MTTSATDKLPKEAYAILNDIGVPSHLLGYDYLAKAITLVAEDPSKLNHMTKVLYPEVAEAFSTTQSRTERAIRHAVEVIFDNCEQKVIQKYFGNSISIHHGKVTNTQFISTLARVLRN